MPGQKPLATLSFAVPKGSANDSAYIYGVEFIYGSNGISVHNLAHGYARTEAWGARPEEQFAYLNLIAGGIQLAVISLGVNDSINGAGTTPLEYRQHLVAIIDYLKKTNPDISIVIYDEISTRRGETAGVLPQTLVRQEEIQIARQEHIGFLSPLPMWGYFSQASERGLYAQDSVHPSDLGGRNLGLIITEYLGE